MFTEFYLVLPSFIHVGVVFIHIRSPVHDLPNFTGFFFGFRGFLSTRLRLQHE